MRELPERVWRAGAGTAGARMRWEQLRAWGSIGPHPGPIPGNGSQQALAFHRHSENAFLLPGSYG